jgi:tetratricopeptide (TPR) repeat protein
MRTEEPLLHDPRPRFRSIPGLADAFFVRGGIHRSKGELARAMTDLTRAIALNANYAPSFVARGDVFNAKRDFGRSVADDDRAPSIAPDNRYAQEMKRQAVVAKSELAGQSAILCGGNHCGTSYSNEQRGGRGARTRGSEGIPGSPS